MILYRHLVGSALLSISLMLWCASCGGGGGSSAGGTTAPPLPPAPTPPAAPNLVKRTTTYVPSGRKYEEGYVIGTPEVKTGVWSTWSDSVPAVLLFTKTYVNGTWDQSLPWFQWDTAGVPVTDWTNAPTVNPPSAPTASDPYVKADGSIDVAAYNAWAIDVSDAGMNRRLGPVYADYDHTGESAFPTVYERDAVLRNASDPGDYVWTLNGTNPVDYTAMAGQTLYVPDPGLPVDSPARFGVDRMWFAKSYHQNHGGAQYWHVYQLLPSVTRDYSRRPDTSVWIGRDPPPDPANSWITANGGNQENLRRPVAVGRGHVVWSNCGVILWPNGFIGASGYGNNEDKYPYLQLPPNKVPTAVSVTPNNEFALVTVWDTSGTPKGQVAVIALEARALVFHSWWYAGLPNAGTYTRMKLLGFIDLPASMKAPTSISSTVDVSHWSSLNHNYNQANLGRLDTQAERTKWYNSVDDQHISPRSGFAVVASRGENRVAFIDLEPLIAYYRSMYFTTQANFNQTAVEGSTDNSWPYTFAYYPAQKPTVHSVVNVPQPCAVACGLDIPYNAGGFRDNAFIGTGDGRLLIYSAGHLAELNSTGAGPHEIGGLRVGRNPCMIANGGLHMRDDQKHFLSVVSRGDRSITMVAAFDEFSYVVKTLRDTRLVDPVCIDLIESRGATLGVVSDYNGGKLSSYLYNPIKTWEEYLFGGLGATGSDLFEFTGSFVVPGKPFVTSAAEVN